MIRYSNLFFKSTYNIDKVIVLDIKSKPLCSWSWDIQPFYQRDWDYMKK